MQLVLPASTCQGGGRGGGVKIKFEIAVKNPPPLFLQILIAFERQQALYAVGLPFAHLGGEEGGYL